MKINQSINPVKYVNLIFQTFFFILILSDFISNISHSNYFLHGKNEKVMNEMLKKYLNDKILYIFFFFFINVY